MRDLDHAGVWAVLSHDRGGRGIVHDYTNRFLYQPLQHCVSEEQAIASGAGAITPKRSRNAARPFAVVIYELVDVLFAIKVAQRKMLKDCIVKDNHPGILQRPAIYGGVELVVTKVINVHISIAIQAQGKAALKSREQCIAV